MMVAILCLAVSGTQFGPPRTMRIYGMIVAVILAAVMLCRKTISVANFVRAPSCLEKRIPVMPSRTELFPAERSPQTINWGTWMSLTKSGT